MVADVYSGDEDLREFNVDATRVLDSCMLRIEADIDPCVLLRVASVVNLANVAPWSATLITRAEVIEISVELRRIREPVAEFIRRKLLQLTCVSTVQLSTSGLSQSEAIR